jgi:peptide/nickel transport system permease protein
MKLQIPNVSTIKAKLDGTQGRILGLRSDMVERLLRTVRRQRKAQVGLTIVASFVFLAVFGPMLVPYDPMAQQFAMLKPPGWFGSENLLGTDTFGRDMLSRIIIGARISLLVALASVGFGALLGIVVGIVSGYFGGWVDDALMRFVDVTWAFPFLLIAILLAAIAGRSVYNVIFALGFAYFDQFARLARGEVLAIREEEYVMAAKSIGLGDIETMFGEILPNMIAPLIVQMTIMTARAMISESTLSFLGLGVDPSTPTWGSLLGQGRNFIVEAWWISLLPGFAIMISVIGINLFGDALRDAFDVKEEV